MTDILPITELEFNDKIPIDELNTQDGIDLMIECQLDAVKAVKNISKNIHTLVNQIFDHLNKSKEGRLIYVGAGTSGRIGVQDGAELYPTFGWPKHRVDFLIAGGEKSLIESIENAEDDVELAKEFFKKISLNEKDVVLGLAASGNTAFTSQILSDATNKGALTIAISNNLDGKILKMTKLAIVLNTGPEVITGSTRLKAGTAQKICLNTISSMVMVKMKRVKNGQMSHLVATNNKLRKRKKRISKLLNLKIY